MNRVVFAIFAHPDDETLVAGTLMKLHAEGAAIYLVTMTSGDAGTNPSGTLDLASLRLEEWRRSAAIIGTTGTYPLHYPDGALSTSDIPALTEAIATLIRSTPRQSELSIISFDKDGVTGHPDHIIAHTVANKLTEDFRGTGMYFRLSSEHARQGPGTDEFPLTGYPIADMDLCNDVRPFMNSKRTVMDCHESQKRDMAKWKECSDDVVATECFRLVTY